MNEVSAFIFMNNLNGRLKKLLGVKKDLKGAQFNREEKKNTSIFAKIADKKKKSYED